MTDPTNKQIIAAVRQSAGSVAAAARALGVSRRLVEGRMERDPVLRRQVDAAREKGGWVKTRAGWRRGVAVRRESVPAQEGSFCRRTYSRPSDVDSHSYRNPINGRTEVGVRLGPEPCVCGHGQDAHAGLYSTGGCLHVNCVGPGEVPDACRAYRPHPRYAGGRLASTQDDERVAA